MTWGFIALCGHGIFVPPITASFLSNINNKLNSTQQDITDVGADTSYVRIYMSNLIKTLRL